MQQITNALVIFFGVLLLVSCGPGATDYFVLGDSDYQLDCNPYGEDEQALSCQLAYYTNRDRGEHPEESNYSAPLNWDADLAQVALGYSQKMCTEGFFDHVDPSGNRIGSRLDEAGIFWVKSGENLARGEYLRPEEAEQLFMREPVCEKNHRGNILDPEFTHTGVGVYFCGSTSLYTQVFASFDPAPAHENYNSFCQQR